MVVEILARHGGERRHHRRVGVPQPFLQVLLDALHRRRLARLDRVELRVGQLHAAAGAGHRVLVRLARPRRAGGRRVGGAGRARQRGREGGGDQLAAGQ